MKRLNRTVEEAEYRDLLARFPKCPAELPAAYRRIFDEHYLDSREGRSPLTALVVKLEGWNHRMAARTADASVSTLEIGAGTLNQLAWEETGIYDIVEPYRMLYENRPDFARVRRAYGDMAEIPAGTRYGRIVSVASFEHIRNLPEVVDRCGALLEPDGVLSVSIPNEGRFLWHFSYTMTTGLAFRLKYGLDYEVWMRYEHVNTADEIETLLCRRFSDVRMALCGVGKTFSFYRYYECRGPRP